jgi:hypothetical protein
VPLGQRALAPLRGSELVLRTAQVRQHGALHLGVALERAVGADREHREADRPHDDGRVPVGQPQPGRRHRDDECDDDRDRSAVGQHPQCGEGQGDGTPAEARRDDHQAQPQQAHRTEPAAPVPDGHPPAGGVPRREDRSSDHHRRARRGPRVAHEVAQGRRSHEQHQTASTTRSTRGLPGSHPDTAARSPDGSVRSTAGMVPS